MDRRPKLGGTGGRRQVAPGHGRCGPTSRSAPDGGPSRTSPTPAASAASRTSSMASADPISTSRTSGGSSGSSISACNTVALCATTSKLTGLCEQGLRALLAPPARSRRSARASSVGVDQAACRPRAACVSASTNRTGTASAMPPPIITLIPMTRPSASASGPPELPGAMATSARSSERPQGPPVVSTPVRMPSDEGAAQAVRMTHRQHDLADARIGPDPWLDGRQPETVDLDHCQIVVRDLAPGCAPRRCCRQRSGRARRSPGTT